MIKDLILKLMAKEVEYEKVNNAFIGFEIKKGTHHVEIEYAAPNALLGKIVSLISFGIFIIILVYDRCVRSKVNE